MKIWLTVILLVVLFGCQAVYIDPFGPAWIYHDDKLRPLELLDPNGLYYIEERDNPVSSQAAATG